MTKASRLDLTWDATYSCRLKSGLTYTVKLAKKDDKQYAAISAIGPGLKSVQITKTESDEELKKKEALLLAAQTAQEFTPRHAPWVYELASWTADKMRKPLADLIEEIPSDDEPEEITASHILIGYTGAERSEATRSKDEAKTLADTVLAKAQADGADFAALAGEYSDGPTRNNGGDLGAFKKGKMAPAFEKAAFKPVSYTHLRAHET